jgi:hypothetical protein
MSLHFRPILNLSKRNRQAINPTLPHKRDLTLMQTGIESEPIGIPAKIKQNSGETEKQDVVLRK